ncbi:MAG TPA: DUF1801 domain-containing protein [Polyangiaceae bacterium]|jgi:hypothetical protein|nr:DUF1801 domain-containing protein [Polyangiaceae bacterium]
MKAKKKVVTKKQAPPVAKKKVVEKVAKLAAKKVPPAPPSMASQGVSVDDYLTKVAPWQRMVIEKLRVVVKAAAPSAVESIKWGQPVYEHKGPFAYIKAHAAQVNFGFWRGAELDDTKRMLQGEGERMRHVKILETHVIDELTLAAFVKQAIALNDKKGDPTKG